MNIYNQKIIDMHVHIYPEKIAGRAVEAIGQYYGVEMIPDGGYVEHLLQTTAHLNVEKFLIHSTATTAAQVQAINNFIAESLKKSDKFVGFGTLHQDYADLQGEVERMKTLGLRGVKLHPEFQNFYVDSPEAFRIYEAISGKMILLIHMGDAQRDNSLPYRLKRVLETFPDMTVIAAHFGGFMHWDEAEEHLVGKNVYFDTSSILWKIPAHRLVELIRKHDITKIVFGTDYPMWAHEEELKTFMALPLTDEEKQRILWKNAQELLS